MAPCSHYQAMPPSGHGRGNPPPPVPPIATSCAPDEPVMHRYPHPVAPQVPLPSAEVADLHFLRCTLAYQNQLLADIKALLQALVQQGQTNDG